jgi:WD40 repeat protein
VKSIVKEIISITVRPESTELAFCCNDRKLYTWDYADKNPIMEYFHFFSKEECDGLSCIKYSPNGKFLMVGTTDAVIYICCYVFDEIEKKEVR